MARLCVTIVALSFMGIAPFEFVRAQTTEAARTQSDSTQRIGLTAPQRARPRPVSTVPLPNGRGVFYYRAGTPGGVRIRSRSGTRRDTLVAAEAAAVNAQRSSMSPTQRAYPAAPSAYSRVESQEGLTRLDLLELERNLIASFEQRLGALESRLDRRQATVQSEPQQPTPAIVIPSEPLASQLPAVTPRVPSPVVTQPPAAPAPPDPPRLRPTETGVGSVTVEEIERAILETGLFRTTMVNFEFAKAALLPVSERTLNALGSVLHRHAALRVEVGGHTDNVGSDATNDRLSQRRAESVVNYLVSVGVDRARLDAVGYGERQPVASNSNETGRALNRRVEFSVLNPEAAEQIRRTIRVDGSPDASVVPSDDSIRRILREELERLRNKDSQQDNNE